MPWGWQTKRMFLTNNLQKERSGFRQKAAFSNFRRFAALCRDAATVLKNHSASHDSVIPADRMMAGRTMYWKSGTGLLQSKTSRIDQTDFQKAAIVFIKMFKPA
jgi:hypothetical protein